MLLDKPHALFNAVERAAFHEKEWAAAMDPLLIHKSPFPGLLPPSRMGTRWGETSLGGKTDLLKGPCFSQLCTLLCTRLRTGLCGLPLLKRPDAAEAQVVGAVS